MSKTAYLNVRPGDSLKVSLGSARDGFDRALAVEMPLGTLYVDMDSTIDIAIDEVERFSAAEVAAATRPTFDRDKALVRLQILAREHFGNDRGARLGWARTTLRIPTVLTSFSYLTNDEVSTLIGLLETQALRDRRSY